jgi:hypothetical protein
MTRCLTLNIYILKSLGPSGASMACPIFQMSDFGISGISWNDMMGLKYGTNN